jgi:transcription elongation factor Elf1
MAKIKPSHWQLIQKTLFDLTCPHCNSKLVELGDCDCDENNATCTECKHTFRFEPNIDIPSDFLEG